jgi:hypothetical protein
VSVNNRRGFMTATIAGLATASAVAAEEGQQDVKGAVEQALAKARQRREAELTDQQAAYGKALVARFGPGVVDVIKETTITRARGWLQAEQVAERNLDAVKTLLWDKIGRPFEWQVVERTPTSLKFKVTRCPLAERMRQLDAAELGFAYHCAYDIGFCQGLNPAIKFTRTKTLMQGHDCCDHAYELASAAVEPKQG